MPYKADKKTPRFLMGIKHKCFISLNTKQPQKIFDAKTYAAVRQDK
jgi:hypothetical protein